MAANGKLPASDLRVTHLYYPGTVNGRRLKKSAANAAEAMALAFALEFGKPLYATDGYRDYATQVQLKKEKGPYAATPGSSNHGWGLALDLASNVSSFSSAEHKWVRANGPKFGWVHPTWAHDGNPANGMDEPWHFEYTGGGKTAPRIQSPKSGEVGLGTKGAKAREVQQLLNKNLVPRNSVVVDGDFGLMSCVAVIKFQQSRGLAATGRVGKVTLARLKGKAASKPSKPKDPKGPTIYLKQGTSNKAGTKALQAFLNRFYPANKLVEDGIFGPATEAALKHWQGKAGLAKTGTVGPKTRARLVKFGVFEPLK